jgi:CelD/BcsL family acetyltransferase involved in cellulose biosynthesis
MINAPQPTVAGLVSGGVDRWLALYERSVEQPVVQHPCWLQAMFTELGDAASGFAQVCSSEDIADRETLISLAALQRQHLLQGYLWPVAVTWDSGFLFSGMPLLDAKKPQDALAGLVTAAADRYGVRAVLFRKVPLDGPFFVAAKKLESAGCCALQVFDRHERAVLKCETSFTNWFNTNFSKKRRKEFQRMQNRLAELGDLRIEEWQSGVAVNPWIEGFLKLEAAGWKGAQGTGTAIACDPNQEQFFRQALASLATQGLLRFWRIDLDGEPIAMLFALQGGQRVILGKMAYQQDLARYSPGVMIILEATRTLLQDSSIDFVDSAADPDHPMIDNIWRDRMAVGDMLISIPGSSRWLFPMMIAAESGRRYLRNLAKRAYYLIARRKK